MNLAKLTTDTEVTIKITKEGEVFLKANDEQTLLDQLEKWEDTRLFAEGVSIAVKHFTGIKPQIIIDKEQREVRFATK